MGAATIAAKPIIPSERASRVRAIVSSLMVSVGWGSTSATPIHCTQIEALRKAGPALRLDACQQEEMPRGYQFSAHAASVCCVAMQPHRHGGCGSRAPQHICPKSK